MDGPKKITENLILKLKGAYLGFKQGEALERATWPRNTKEALGLGNYNVKANLALNSIILLEETINDLCTIKETIEDKDGNLQVVYRSKVDSNHMEKFAENVAVASGSRSAKRMEKSLETIGALGQFMELPKGKMPQPQQVDLNQ